MGQIKNVSRGILRVTTKNLRIGRVFVQVCFEVAAINNSNIATFVRADKHCSTLLLNIYLYQKPSVGYGQDRILMPQMLQDLKLLASKQKIKTIL